MYVWISVSHFGKKRLINALNVNGLISVDISATQYTDVFDMTSTLLFLHTLMM